MRVSVAARLCALASILAITSACAGQAASAALSESAERGRELFVGAGACRSCHSLEQDERIIGPSLYGVASRAAERESDLSAEQYLHEAITEPNKYIVAGFDGGLMPQTYATKLSNVQIDDLVAYLLTLK
ncbi:MAG: c-type cytochrome [Anaerolineae bacterium]